MSFNKDTMVYPYQSEMFQDRKLGKNTDPVQINEMTETDLYINDTIGLKTLNEAKKIRSLVMPTGHL